MKKLILTAAAAMMVLASCTKTKVESIDGPKEIAFKKIEGAMTKETLDQLNDKTMGVYAIYHGATTNDDASYYFKNISYGPNTPSGPTAWVATPSQYWPLSGALDFVVYAPWFETEVTYNQETKILRYENATNGETDFLYGKYYYNNDTNYDAGVDGPGYTKTNNNITVDLKHALAKVDINFILTNATISRVTLNDIIPGGTFTYNYTNNTISSTPNGTAAPKTLSSDPYETIIFPNQAQTSLTINYKLGSIDKELSTNIDLSSFGLWERGKKYIYNITITAQEIKFEPSVIDWETTVSYSGTVDGLS